MATNTNPEMPNLLSFKIGGAWDDSRYAGMASWGARPASYRQPLQSSQSPMNFLPLAGNLSSQMPGDLPASSAGPSSADAGSILSSTHRKVVKSNNGGLGGPQAAKAPLIPQPQGALSPAEYAAAMQKGATSPAAAAGTPAGALPAVPQNAPGYNEMLDAKNFENTLGAWKLGISGLQTVGSIGLGIWQMLQAQEMQRQAKGAYLDNYNNTAQAYNTRMEDQYRAARGNSPETAAAIEARKIKPSSIT